VVSWSDDAIVVDEGELHVTPFNDGRVERKRKEEIARNLDLSLTGARIPGDRLHAVCMDCLYSCL
jgi:hypothetical protein